MGNADAHSRRGGTGDDFKTPKPCVRALLDNMVIPKKATILDPCCGSRAIGNVLREYGYEHIKEYDLHTGSDCRADFHEEIFSFDYILMNSPYSDKTRFMFKAFTVATTIICIFPQNVTNYNAFQALFLDMPYYRGRYLMRPKFFMTEEDTEDPVRGGVSAYAWFVWKTTPRRIGVDTWERYIDLGDYFRKEK